MANDKDIERAVQIGRQVANEKRIETLISIADKIDEIQRRKVYDTIEGFEVHVCEEWLKIFLNDNGNLHGMEVVYHAFILWKLRWMRDEIDGMDTDSNDTYYQTADEFLEGELVRAQG